MKERLMSRARRDFFEQSEDFLESLHDLFPECEDTSELLTLFKGATKGSEARENEFLQSWVANMHQPLQPKYVKYAKALERILDAPGIVFHACQYRDAEALHLCCESAMLSKIKLYDKFNDPRMNEHKDLVWKYIDRINECAYVASDLKVPRVPTRDEINANIASQKKKTDKTANSESNPSMLCAFASTFKDMCTAIEVSSEIKLASDDDKRTVVQRWATMLRTEIEGKKMSALCEARDLKALVGFRGAFSELEWPSTLTNDAWSAIQQLNTFSVVTDSIPQKMMGRIEHLANQLADDLVAGNKDLSSLSLADIGQQVLAGCDASDMDKFAGNIGDILPALQQFHQKR